MRTVPYLTKLEHLEAGDDPKLMCMSYFLKHQKYYKGLNKYLLNWTKKAVDNEVLVFAIKCFRCGTHLSEKSWKTRKKCCLVGKNPMWKRALIHTSEWYFRNHILQRHFSCEVKHQKSSKTINMQSAK